MSKDDVIAQADRFITLIDDLVRQTESQVSAATLALRGVYNPDWRPTTPRVENVDTAFKSPPGNLIRRRTPPVFEGVYDPEELLLPELDDPPDPRYGDFNYRSPTRPGGVKEFRERVPNVDTKIENVEIPDLQELAPLDLIELKTDFRDPNVIIPEFDAVAPTPPDPLTGLIPAYQNERDRGLAAVQSGHEVLFDRYMAKHFPKYDEQRDALDAHLCGVLDGTKTAWSDTTQRRLYDIARSQADAERRRVDAEVERNLVRQGNVLQISTQHARLRVEETLHANNTRAAYDTAERRADRELQHLQFNMSMLAQFRQTAQQAWFGTAELIINQSRYAIEAGRQLADLMVTEYNTLVTQFNSELQLYQTKAQVWETRLKAALVEYEVLKVELEAERLKSDINQQKIAEQQNQLQLQRLKIEAASEKIRAIAIKADLRKIPLEIFEAKVRAYQAYVSGKNAEINAYQAEIQGERAELDAHLAEVDVYLKELDAWRTKIQGRSERSRLIGEHNRNLLDVLRFELEKANIKLRYDEFTTENERLISRERFESYRLELEQHYRAVQTELQTIVEQVRAETENNRQYGQIVVEQMRAFYQRIAQLGQVAVQGAEVLANTAAGLATANGSVFSLIDQTNRQE